VIKLKGRGGEPPDITVRAVRCQRNCRKGRGGVRNSRKGH